MGWIKLLVTVGWFALAGALSGIAHPVFAILTAPLLVVFLLADLSGKGK